MDAVLQSLVGRLFKIVDEQATNVIGFKDEAEDLKMNLLTIKSFLADSSNLNITNKEDLKAILIKLRTLMNEADDVLTDCQIKEEYSGVFSSVFLGNLFFRLKMGHRLKAINSEIKKLTGNSSFAQHTNSQTTGYGGEHQNRRLCNSQVVNSSEIIGLDDDVNKMKGWILGGNSGAQINKIGIVGMGGLGKTTVAKKIFSDEGIKSSFEKKIWLSVSKLFNEIEMLGSIQKQLKGPDASFSGCDDSNTMLIQICEFLGEKSYLIMLDDVWEQNLEWCKRLCSEMPIPKDVKDGHFKRSCIIVTTRDVKVATDLGVDNAQIHKPNFLTNDESLVLFWRHAFPKEESLRKEFDEVGNSIAMKCGGLPLAIKTMGALVQPKRRVSEWDEVYTNFHRILGPKENSSINPIMASLQLSYADLPSYLKQCMLSFAIFPEDAEIEAEQMICWWLGESLIPHGDELKSAMEEGYASLYELSRRCLIEPIKCRVHDGRLYSCKMHDMVRELAITIAETDGFCNFTTEGKQKFTPSESQWLGLTEKTIQTGGETSKINQSDPKLRALVLVSSSSSSTAHQFNARTIIGLQLNSLRVLDLSHPDHINLLEEKDMNGFWKWVTSLERLAYLNLSGLACLKTLPRSICKLRNLQFLIARNCKNLSQVHSSIPSHLKKLIILDLGLCPVLEYLPCRLQNFSNLQELSGFRIADRDKRKCCRFNELKKFKNLRVLRIYVGDDSAISKDELTALEQLDRLKVLAINSDMCSSRAANKTKFNDNHVFSMLEGLSPPPKLEELYLKKYRRETLWGWINPTKLTKLLYLSIEEGNIVSLLQSESEQTWKIEGLCMKHLLRLKMEWKSLQMEMPLLRAMEISRCTLLEGFPCRVDRPDIWIKPADSRN